MSQTKTKIIKLTFRGFDISPAELESLVKITASRKATKGELRKPYLLTTWPRSFVSFKLEFDPHKRIAEMVPALLLSLGGIDHLCKVRDLVNPEFLEIDMFLPVRHSEEQEDGYFPLEVIRDICILRATLGLSFP